jgi:hypothetical protein
MPLASLAGGRKVLRTCPTCHRFLTAKLICWKCCERLCRVCGNPTGSAFIETCWPCSYWQDVGREAGREFHATNVTEDWCDTGPARRVASKSFRAERDSDGSGCGRRKHLDGSDHLAEARR